MILIHALQWEGWRYVNAVLALFVVVLLSWGCTVRWHEMPTRIQRIAPWVILTYAIIAYGSVDLATQATPVPAGIRVLLTTLDLVGLLIALLYGIQDEEYHLPRKGGSFH